MKRDHFVVRPASPVRPLRCRTGFACKTILVLALYSLFFIPAFAQSNLTYELKVGTTGEVQVLTNFPESYQGEKVNVRVQTASLTDRYADRIQTASLKDFDFIFAGEEPIEGFSEVYRFTEGEQEWVVWRNGKEIKNRSQRTLGLWTSRKTEAGYGGFSPDCYSQALFAMAAMSITAAAKNES